MRCSMAVLPSGLVERGILGHGPAAVNRLSGRYARPPMGPDRDANEPRVTAAMCAYGRVLAEPRLSPDADRVAFVATAGGQAQLVVVVAEGGPELVVTSDPPPRPAASYGGGAFDWAPDGESLLYAALDGGLWRAPARGGRPERIVESPPGGPVGAPAVSPDGASVAFSVDQHDVAVVALDGRSWPVRLSGEADFCFDPSWSRNGEWVVWHEWDVPHMPWDDSRLCARRADGTGPVEIVADPPGASVQQPRFAPDDSQLGYLDDRDGWLNLWAVGRTLDDHRPLLAEHHEHGGPSWGLGQRSFAWAPDSRRVALCRNEVGFGSLLVLDLAGGGVRAVGRGVHGSLDWRGDRLVALRSGVRTPTEVVVYEGADLSLRRTIARGPLGGFAELDLDEPEAVTWLGADGAAVHGRLYRPRRSATGQDPAPLLAWVHGGPTGQWPVSFLPRFVYWLERGWAILVPDHRGSTGHGRAYTQAMAARWGDLDTADVAAGMRAAADRGWADRARMVPMGGSAGGFTVLNLLAHHGELCAAGVDLFGVADLFDLDESTHRFEAHYLHSLVGPLPAAAAAYHDRSPVNVAERIDAPLLILQGAEDKVVPVAQSRAIAERLRALGRTVELHVYDGEGHGWGRPETTVDELERVESFLRRHVLRGHR